MSNEEARKHAETLESLIDGEHDDLYDLLRPIAEFLRRGSEDVVEKSLPDN